MIKAKPGDKNLICGLLASSFADNPSVNYVIAQNSGRPQRIVALMAYSFERCMRFGEVWLSDDRNGCALLLFPHKKHGLLYSAWLDIKFVCTAVRIWQLPKLLVRERRIAAKQPKGRGAHLLFIGVKPLYQHSGIGSELLINVLERMDELGLAVHLETSVPGNLPWYQKFGFEVYDQVDLGYKLFLLARVL